MSRDVSNRPNKYNHVFSVSSTDIERYRKLLNWFKQYHRRFSSAENWPSSVLRILDNVSDLSFVSAYMLAWTCCRSAELKQISFEQIQYFTSFEIKSSKSKHVRIVKPLHSFKFRTLTSLHQSTPISVVSYDQLRNSIKKARDVAGVSLPDGALNCTHIFRHLIASHYAKNNVSIAEISNILGHSSHKTTEQYIHNI